MTSPYSDAVAAPGRDDANASDHGMRPVAFAFVIANALVLGVFAMVVATGHLEVGGALDIAVASATAAPVQ